MGNHLITTERDLYDAYGRCARYNGFIAFDTETYGQTTDWVKRKSDRIVWDYTARMAGFSFSFMDDAFYIPTGHADINLDHGLVRRFLRAFFNLPNRFWAHNIDYDARVIRNFVGEYIWPQKMGDSMVLLWLLNRGVKVIRNGKEVYLHGLKDNVLHHFKHTMSRYDDVITSYPVLVQGPTDDEVKAAVDAKAQELHESRGQLSFFRLPLGARNMKKLEMFERKLKKTRVYKAGQMNNVPAYAALDYACEDAFWSNQIAIRFWPELLRMNYSNVWDTLEMPILRIIREMHDVGLIVDENKVKEIKDFCLPKMDELASKFKDLTGAEITSNQQCVNVFYGGYTKCFVTKELRVDESGTSHEVLCVKKGGPAFSGGVFPIKDAPRTKLGDSPAVNYDALVWAKHVTKDNPQAQELIDLKLKYAEIAKLATTYTDSVVAQIPFSPDRRVRPRYNQTGTNTGRFSSSNPFNAQNFPTKSDHLPDIREAFLPPPGYVFASMDFSQIEIILMAHFSGDPKLREVILENKSMHDVTAEALGVERKVAKAVNFLKNYGGGAKKLAQSLNVPLEEKKLDDGTVIKAAPDWVQQYCNMYDELYAGVTEYRRAMSDYAAQYGYVETLLGRRRALPNLKALREQVAAIEEKCRRAYTTKKYKPHLWNEDQERLLFELKKKRRALTIDLYAQERIASNTPIQGSAADLIKLAMVAIYNNWKERGVDNYIVMQIHDELVFYLRKETAEKELDNIRSIMVNIIKISLPITASGGLGDTWGACK